MKNAYDELRAIQHERFEEWTAGKMFFAFSMEQFREGMESIGLDPDKDQNKIYRIPGGGYIRKSDAEAFHKLMQKNADELQEAIAADQTGEGFIYQMFKSEMYNHEYGYTEDLSDTLDALGMEYEDIEKNPALSHGLAKAAREVIENTEC